MLAFPTMIVKPALEAKMEVPPDELLDDPDSFRESHPHFFVFCQLQLGRSMSDWQEHWDNAKVIACIPDEKLKKMTLKDFSKAGVRGID